MNKNDRISSGMTRRSFMKKSSLTVGAITLLSMGTGLAEGGSGSCPPKTTESNSGTARKTREDTFLQYSHKDDANRYYAVLKSGTETDGNTGTYANPPGAFPTNLSKNGCAYVKDSSPPAQSSTGDSGWTFSSGSPVQGDEVGPSLPEPASDWVYISSTKATYEKKSPWTSTQAYILQ